MSRLIITVVVIAVVLTVYAVIDCAMTDAKRTRALSKPVWMLVTLVVPVVGPILWILFGKGLLLKDQPATQFAPDDDETFLRSLGSDAAHDERIRQLEDELRALDEQLATGDLPRDPRETSAEAPTASAADADAPAQSDTAGDSAHDAANGATPGTRRADNDDDAGTGTSRA